MPCLSFYDIMNYKRKRVKRIKLKFPIINQKMVDKKEKKIYILIEHITSPIGRSHLLNVGLPRIVINLLIAGA